MSNKNLPPGVFEELVEALGSHKKASKFAEWSNYDFGIIMRVIAICKIRKSIIIPIIKGWAYLKNLIGIFF